MAGVSVIAEVEGGEGEKQIRWTRTSAGHSISPSYMFRNVDWILQADGLSH